MLFRSLRLEPCRSPVWDTAIATIALREAGVPAAHPSLRRSVQWLLDRETKVLGDWAVRHGFQEPAGWYFEFRNQFYPDVDDTIMVMIALSRMLPEQELRRWQAEFVVGAARPAHSDQGVVSAVWGGQAQSKDEALADLQALSPMLGRFPGACAGSATCRIGMGVGEPSIATTIARSTRRFPSPITTR